MIQLDLTGEETDILRTALESFLSDLRMEISNTDQMDFREDLKYRKSVLMKVLDGLPKSA